MLALAALAGLAACEAPQERPQASAANTTPYAGPFQSGGLVFFHGKPSQSGPLDPVLQGSHPGALLWVFEFTQGAGSFARRVEIARSVVARDPDCEAINVSTSVIAGQSPQPSGGERYVLLPVMCRF